MSRSVKFSPQIQNFFSAWLVQEHFYRLDPVRGCFALTASEAAELLQRYRAYGRRGKAVGVCWGEQATAWHDGNCRLDSHGLMVMVTAYLCFVFDREMPVVRRLHCQGLLEAPAEQSLR